MGARLSFLSAGAARGLVTTIAGEAGIEVAGTFGAVGAILEKFRAGEPCEVVILTHAQIMELAAQGRVVAGSASELGTVATAIAVRMDDRVPDVADATKLREALLAADSIHFPDPARATAGIHFAKVLEILGIREATQLRWKIYENGSTAMRHLAQSTGRAIGCTQATEIVATPGVRLVAPLPTGLDLVTVYTGAVAADAAKAEAARFLALLTGDASSAKRSAAGFGGPAIRPASAADLAAIRRIVDTVLGEYGLAMDAKTDGDLDDLQASYFARGGTFDVAVAADGRIVGCCGVLALDDATGELRKMYLLKEARGFGIGGRLLARAIAFARGRGWRRLELETASVLKEAIALYTGAGFTPIARAHLAARCDQAYALDL